MPTGIIKEYTLNSRLLRKNPMGNPTRRKLQIYTPPGFKKGESLPCLMFLPGFGSYPEKWHAKDFPGHRLLDLLILSEKIPRCILCTVDGMTRLGGSQYVDSALNGPFMSHITEEIVPYLKEHFTIQDGIGLCGHSSGGFGALNIASLYPQLFPRVASFAGDMHFELTHKNMLSSFANDFRSGKLQSSLRQCLEAKKTDYILGLSAGYSPNLSDKKWKMDFPLHIDSAEFREDVWKRWLALDPVEWIPQRKKALKSLDLLYLSCGAQDQYALHLGADCFAHRCKAQGITCSNEHHEGNHSLLIRQLERGFSLLLGVNS